MKRRANLKQELYDKVYLLSNGGGFGAPEAIQQHDREIAYLTERIRRRQTWQIAAMSAVVGAAFSTLTTIIVKLFFE